MNANVRRAAIALAATGMAVSLAACGSAKQAGGGSGSSGSGKSSGDPNSFTVGLLLPENQTYRYEHSDKPLITKDIQSLTNGKAKVIYDNAKNDATTQNQQVSTMIANKVKVLIVDPVDAKAIQNSVQQAVKAGIKVVAYDRLADGPISAYTSFDNVEVGRVQANALVQKLGSKADGGKIVMINGASTDPNAAQFKQGAMSVFSKTKGLNIAVQHDTPNWDPQKANEEMSGDISKVGKANIAGVYSANDDMAGGIITAMKQAGMDPKQTPVTGQDSTLAGVQRILSGTQFMSVYKSYAAEAQAASEMAVDLGKGASLDSAADSKSNNDTDKNIPTKIVPVVALTKDNIKDTVIKDSLYPVSDICTADFKAACTAAGIS